MRKKQALQFRTGFGVSVRVKRASLLKSLIVFTNEDEKIHCVDIHGEQFYATALKPDMIRMAEWK